MQVQQERVRNQFGKDEGVAVRPSRRAHRLDPRKNDRPVKSRLPHPKRWLQKQLGRRWDDVYSDIRTKFSNKGPKWYWECYVLQNVSVKNGKIYNERGIEIVAGPSRWTNEVGYVHPDTGIFTKIPIIKESKKYKRPAQLLSPVFGNDGNRYLVVKTKSGSWFCRYKGIKPWPDESYDNLLKRYLTVYKAHDYYGRSIYVTEKRQITTKEYIKLTKEN